MTTAPAIALAVALAATSQPEREGLRRVAPGYEDWSPVALSQRFEPVDTRTALFFEDVYEGERPGVFGGPPERVYMRMHGGVVAVFPQSSYVETQWGIEAEIPPGTVFHLGAPEELLAGAAPAIAAPRPGQVSLRQDLSAGGGMMRAETEQPAPGLRATGAAAEAAGPPSILTNEAYRQRRMAALLAEAAQAERGG